MSMLPGARYPLYMNALSDVGSSSIPPEFISMSPPAPPLMLGFPVEFVVAPL